MEFSIFNSPFSISALVLLFGTLFFVPFFSQAAGLVPCGGIGEPPCNLCFLFKMFANVVDFVIFKLVPPLAILMIAFGGLMFFLAAGNPSQVSRARGILISVFVGLFIIYSAWLLVGLFFASISESIGFTANFATLPEDWFKFNCN